MDQLSPGAGAVIAAKAIGGVSAIFLLPVLAILAFVAPEGPGGALMLGGAYFAPLAAWILVTARPAVRFASVSRLSAFVYSALSVAFAITAAWALLALTGDGLDAPRYLENLRASLGSLGFLWLLGIPMSVLAGIFFVGSIERARAR